MVRSALRATAALVLVAPATMALSQALPAPPPPPAKSPLTETFFGQSVTDDWRGMEKLDPATLGWMKAQGAYTRRLLDSIGPLKALQAKLTVFSGGFGFIDDFAEYGGRLFYTERAPGSDAYDLMVRERDGATRKILDIAALRAAHGGAPYAINYILPSPDGTKVLAGVSSGGSENASYFIYDAATGAQIAGPLDRGRFGVSAWSNDSAEVFLIRTKRLDPGEPETDMERFVQAQVWDLKSPPTPLAGAGSGHGPEITPDEFAEVQITPGSDVAVLIAKSGVKNELRLWVGSARSAADPNARWTPLAGYDDGITNVAVKGDTLYLLSHKGAPTFQLLTLRAGEPLSAAKVLIAARPDRILDNPNPAADALYVESRDGVYSHLLRVPEGAPGEEVPLPVKGSFGSLFSDPRAPGLALELSSWVSPPAMYHFDPARRAFADLHLGVNGDIRADDFEVRDLESTARDGVKVPLTLVLPRTEHRGPRITVIEAYGSYGISELAVYSQRRANFLKAGITYGVCHVRGGGELGEAWRLGGKDESKPNTWRDLIACGDDLVARGLTDKSRLFILGGSAGGITMGRAMEERPDLFAGVLDLVPSANQLRAEFSPNGPPNVPEFGSVKSEAGFRNLYAMDAVLHVKPGVAYPPIMISTGLNDPRVAPWEPAKFAAALEASGDPNPVLLRIDEQAGHGIGSTRSQVDLLTADQIAFVFWRAGLPEWRPALGAK